MIKEAPPRESISYSTGRRCLSETYPFLLKHDEMGMNVRDMTGASGECMDWGNRGTFAMKISRNNGKPATFRLWETACILGTYTSSTKPHLSFFFLFTECKVHRPLKVTVWCRMSKRKGKTCSSRGYAGMITSNS